MMRMGSGLPRSTARGLSQVVASAGLAVLGAMIYAAVPHGSRPTAAPQPELTSGGKFAARIEHAALQAFDGLDTMPLPRVAAVALPGSEVASPMADGERPEPTGPVRVSRQGGNDAAPQALDHGKAARPADAGKAVRAVARRAPATKRIETAALPGTPTLAGAPEPGTDERPDGSLLAQALTTARGAWSLTASASGSLLSRLMP